MKTRTFLTHIVVAASLLCPAAFQALAQAPGGGGGGMGSVLTDEQRTKLRDGMTAAQAELTPLNEKLAAAQKEALKAALAKNPDEKVVREKVDAVGKIQTEIAMLRFKTVKTLAPTITDEQRAKIDEQRPGMTYGMLLGSFGGMGGGRRGGAGGGAGRTQ